MKIIINNDAYYDLEQSAAYYEMQQKGLGKIFITSVKKVIDKIKTFPYAASFIHQNIRYKVINKFPYVIYYEIKNNYIYILRIFNTHRNNDFLLKI